MSILEREATIATLSRAGVKLRNWWSVGAGLQADWRMDEAKGWLYAMAFREHLPSWDHLLDTATAYGTGQMAPPEKKKSNPRQPFLLHFFFGAFSRNRLKVR